MGHVVVEPVHQQVESRLQRVLTRIVEVHPNSLRGKYRCIDVCMYVRMDLSITWQLKTLQIFGYRRRCISYTQIHAYIQYIRMYVCMYYIEYIDSEYFNVEDTVFRLWIHTYVYIYIHVCMHAYIHTYIHTYIHDWINVIYNLSVYRIWIDQYCKLFVTACR